MKVSKSRAFTDRLKGHKQSMISLFSGRVNERLGLSEKRDNVEVGAGSNEEDEGREIGRGEMDKEDRKEMDKIPIREQMIAAAFTEKSLFGSFDDGTIVQWDFSTQGEIIRELKGHQDRVNALAYIPDKNILVNCSHDATIRAWNVQNGDTLAIYKTSGPVHLLRVGEDLAVQAVVSRKIFYQIDITNNSIIKCIKFNKHSITSFFYKDHTLIFGNIQNKVLIYDLKEFDAEASRKIGAEE